jgi:hypothetical protein
VTDFPTIPPKRRYSTAWKADCMAFVAREMAKGRSLYDIAFSIRLSDTTVARWFRDADQQPPVVERRPKVENRGGPRRPKVHPAPPNRDCLKCRRPFHSWGAGNRMCDSCRSHSHIVSPLEPNGGGHTGRRVGTR